MDCIVGMYLQLKVWEEYAAKLEEKYVALMTEREMLQRELASVGNILDDGTDPEIHGMLHACCEVMSTDLLCLVCVVTVDGWCERLSTNLVHACC